MTFVEPGHVQVNKTKRPCEERTTTDPVFLKQKPYPIIPFDNPMQ